MKSYFPEEGTTFVSNTVGIAKGSTHGKLAEAWINFLLEKEQQGRIASNLGFAGALGRRNRPEGGGAAAQRQGA